MGLTSNNFCCNNKNLLIKSMKVSVNSEINEETDDTNEFKNTDKKNICQISEYSGFSPEELEKINEGININYNKYQKVPLKSSDINLIYRSGVIRSNSYNN